MGFFKFILFAFKSHQKSVSRSYTQQTHHPSAYTTKAQHDVVVRSQIQNFPTAKVKWVVDGDTVIVNKGWSEIVIRLDSIDCPEDGQHWGDIAKYGLMKLISRHNVYLEEHGVDVHGRTLGTF